MNSILNKLVEYNIVNVTNGEYLLGEEFIKKVVIKLKKMNCMINYALDIPVVNTKKGYIPVLEGDSTVIPEVVDEIVELDLATVEFVQSKFEIKEMISFIAVNNTTLTFDKKGLENVLVTYLAKCLCKTLNKVAYDKMREAKEVVKGSFIENLLTKAVAEHCLSNPSSSAIFVNKEDINTLLKCIHNKDIPNVLGIPVIVCEGIEGVVVADFESAIAYIHDDSKSLIGTNTNALFKQNKTLITITNLSDVCVLSKNSYTIFEYTYK